MEINQDNISSLLGQEQEGGKEVDPKLKREMESYVAALMHVMHNEKTAGSVVDMLKSAPPEQSIPFAALQINKQVEASFAKKKGKVDDSVKLAGAMYLASDLSELGNTARAWESPIQEQQVPQIFQSIVSKYIHEGIRDGSIDPIKLQKDTEPLLNEQQKKVGMTLQEKLGLPGEPTVSMGVDSYVKKKVTPLEKENQELKSLLQKQQAAQQQSQKQGGMF